MHTIQKMLKKRKMLSGLTWKERTEKNDRKV